MGIIVLDRFTKQRILEVFIQMMLRIHEKDGRFGYMQMGSFLTFWIQNCFICITILGTVHNIGLALSRLNLLVTAVVHFF